MVLVVNLIATSFLCGLGWTIQVVHYPLFDRVDPERWADFHAEHSRRIARVVAFPWAAQGATVVLLLFVRPSAVPVALVLVDGALAAATVVATLALAIPEHQRLAEGFDRHVHRRLVTTNWIRTFAWTGGVVVASWMVVLALTD